MTLIVLEPSFKTDKGFAKLKTMKTLKQLTKDFYFVNNNVTKENFPYPKELRTDYKLYDFDRNISSDDAITEMKKDGYEPANLYELLEWKEWNGTDWVAALGSSCEVGGHVVVPFLGGDRSVRRLRLYWCHDAWYAFYRFLAVRPSSLEPRNTALGALDSLTLPNELIINNIIYIKK